MPEGPEVTIISENLNDILKDSLIVDFKVTETGRYRNKSPDNLLKIQEHFPLKILEVNNKGKLIYFTFEKRFYMLNTLGMSGIWRKKKDKHTSVELKYVKNNKESMVYFTDQRHFGTIKFLTSKGDLDEKLDKIGPDILNDPNMNFELFKRRLYKYKKWNIVKALMDQKVISGVGNYLKSESLYHARLSPFKTIDELTEEELRKLYKSIRLKIVSSYNQGGVSVKNFTDIDDNQGQYHFTFEVYCKKEDPYGNKIEKVVLADKRSTYYVPKLQD